jgi:hypothetical protein
MAVCLLAATGALAQTDGFELFDPQSIEVPAGVVDDVLDDSFQTELPGDAVAGYSWDFTLPDWLRLPIGLVGRAVFWTLAAVVIIVLLTWIGRDVAARLRRRAPVAGIAGGDAGAGVGKELPDAAALAGEHRYAEAIHVLLLRAIAHLGAQRTRPVPDSLTSREVMRDARMPEAARDALGDLILAVEISHFGDAEPDDSDYATCVERFNAFHGALAGEVGA